MATKQKYRTNFAYIVHHQQVTTKQVILQTVEQA